MSAEVVLSRLRTFLLALAGFMCVGTIVELALTKHWDGPTQLVPFVLCGLSLLVIMTVLLRPGLGSIRLLRWVLGISLVGSLFGVFEHVEHNIEFALEIQPNAVTGDVFWKALAGANPLLAPGILAFTAVIALAATYYHPVLTRKQ
ncbi:MAG: hypothetical protein R3C14_14905 [Caldilineaceae bacterium]